MPKFFTTFKKGKGLVKGGKYKPSSTILRQGLYEFISIVEGQYSGNGTQDSPYRPILLMNGPEGEKTYAASYFFPASDFDAVEV